MSVKSNGSTLKDIPNVTTAVEHLQDLAYRMSEDEFGFSEDDIANVDIVIDAIHELEGECGKLHDKLETETIGASVLRHKLQTFPEEIKTQLQAAVNAARDLNSSELTGLQTSLDETNANINALEEKHSQLEKENAVLLPERDRVRQEHEEVIGHLNLRMAEKAGKQIVLNETRERLRETNQKILDLEDDILQLKEDLIQERADARMEKKRLKKIVYDTTLKTREQKDANVVKKKELDELQGKVKESEVHLDEVRKSIRQYEVSKDRLDGQERLLTARLEHELESNDDLKKRGTQLKQTLADAKVAFEENRLQLEEIIKHLDSETEYEIKRNKVLDGEKKKLEEDMAAKMKIRRADEKRVKAENEKLQRAKTDLATTAEDVANLRSENNDMETRIVDLEETHEAIVQTMKKQIEEMREVLAAERKERMDLQGQRDDVQGDLDGFKNDLNKYMNSKNRQIKEGKQKHDDLTKEGKNLQRALWQGDKDIEALRQRLKNTQEVLENTKLQHQREVSGLEGEVTQMKKDIEDKRQALIDQVPNFEQLEAYFEERTKEYEASKKELVVKKNKKMSLDDSVKRGKKDLEKMVQPRLHLESDLKQKRAENLETLKLHADEVKEVESDIYAVGCKLKSTLEENDTFQKAISQLNEELKGMRGLMDGNDDAVMKLVNQLNAIKDLLMADWMEDWEMEKKFADRDQGIVDELADLLDKTEHREQVISGITGKLQMELQALADFLNNVAQRRPPGSSVKRMGSSMQNPE